MPIKPIDMQVMLPKMSEIAMAQGSESQRQLAASQRSMERTRTMVNAATREVRSKDNIQRVTFAEHDKPEDGRGRGGRGGRGARGSQGTYGKGGKREASDGEGQRQDRPSIDVKL